MKPIGCNTFATIWPRKTAKNNFDRASIRRGLKRRGIWKKQGDGRLRVDVHESLKRKTKFRKDWQVVYGQILHRPFILLYLVEHRKCRNINALPIGHVRFVTSRYERFRCSILSFCILRRCRSIMKNKRGRNKKREKKKERNERIEERNGNCKGKIKER